MGSPRPGRVVSGGQTGVDRAALEAALEQGIAIGGWVPKGRRAEDGAVPERYTGLRETPAAEYRVRTEWNVRDSDATLALYRGTLHGGTALTVKIAGRYEKPVLQLNLALYEPDAAVTRIREWLRERRPAVLNVAGSRESGDAGIYEATLALLRRVFAEP